MSKIKTKSVNLVLADLPYGVTNQRWDTIINPVLLWEQYERITTDNAAILLFAKPPFDKILACSNLELYRYDWVWEKSRATGHLNSKKMPMQAHELICVFYKNTPIYNPQKTQGHKPTNNYYTSHNGNCYRGGHVSCGGGNTDRYPRSVIKFAPVSNSKRLHPNQKPQELLEYMIKTYSNEGDLVLDNTMGSGSTGVACKHTNRRFIGIESDKDHFNTANLNVMMN